MTTFDRLDEFVRHAASLGWFKKIQIQTNGRRLSDAGYLEHLIECGVNEFFISVHGREEVHDRITGRKGSYEETMRGMENAEETGFGVISNTVLMKTNFDDVPDLLTSLAGRKLKEIHLWNYFPMEPVDSKDIVISMKDFTKILPRLLSVVEPSGKALVLKSFPECLSVGEPGFFDNRFPTTVLPSRFWMEFGKCGFGTCVYKEKCRAKGCWGLSRAYIGKYGDERELLSPLM